MFLSIVNNGWTLLGRRIWYSMHSVQSARPGCRCCHACTFTWCDGAPRRIGCVALGVGINRLTVNRSAKNLDRLTDRFNRLTDSLTGYCSDPCNALQLLLIILWCPACALFVVWRLNTVGVAPSRLTIRLTG
jgi:hypothetical protein